MRVLVAGGSGFIGKSLCSEFDARGHEVVCLSRTSVPDKLV
ncbi:MAG: NAD-dependent epimerase/dehydratase family protein [Halobacteria archaeon]|nr:NAD-dependent epimerase/dehydratase family protein [Halobacteria archaeon]